ncbi:MAG: ABC transporter ATP-binding protein [Proteobacteria bacterium]|nr:ABC transporter ATP-binding protein [Pseudomonadota bacterium]
MSAGSLAPVAVDGVAKLFGAVRALAGVTLRLAAGDVAAVMGPNGAGKSTLLAILSLTARPTRGTVSFGGARARPGDADARRRVGLLSHQPLLYGDLTGEENLRLFASLYGVDVDDAVRSVSARLDLGRFAADRPVRVLSRGQLQRVALARTLVSRPELLLLDEPAAGLDRAAIEGIAAALAAHREGGGIAVVVTHEPDLAAGVATRAVMLRDGRITADAASPGGADAWRALYREAADGGAR